MRGWSAWLVAIAALVFLYLIRAILPPFVIAVLFAYILVPGVDAVAERFRVHRFFVVAALYLLLILILSALFWWLRPTIMVEVHSLGRDSVEVVRRAIVQLTGSEQFELFGNTFVAHDVARSIVDQVRATFNSPRTAFDLAQALVQRVGEIVLTLIALFYLLLDWESLIGFIFRFVPPLARPRVKTLAQSIHHILGQYLRGQLILIAFVGALTWLALQFVFHIPFALAIAVATGFLEIIPLVGPVVAAGIAAIAALSRAGTNLALAVIIFYTILRQVEDQLVAPNVLGRAVNVHPLAAIFAVLAGGVLAGPLGLVLGVPAAAAVKVVLDAIQTPVSPEQLSAAGEPAKEQKAHEHGSTLV
jgi:predicted PurR-regulated permease PerM